MLFSKNKCNYSFIIKLLSPFREPSELWEAIRFFTLINRFLLTCLVSNNTYLWQIQCKTWPLITNCFIITVAFERFSLVRAVLSKAQCIFVLISTPQIKDPVVCNPDSPELFQCSDFTNRHPHTSAHKLFLYHNMVFTHSFTARLNRIWGCISPLISLYALSLLSLLYPSLSSPLLYVVTTLSHFNTKSSQEKRPLVLKAAADNRTSLTAQKQQ